MEEKIYFTFSLSNFLESLQNPFRGFRNRQRIWYWWFLWCKLPMKWGFDTCPRSNRVLELRQVQTIGTN